MSVQWWSLSHPTIKKKRGEGDGDGEEDWDRDAIKGIDERKKEKDIKRRREWKY